MGIEFRKHISINIILFLAFVSFLTPPGFTQPASSSEEKVTATDIQSVQKELESLYRDLSDLKARQEKLYQDLQGLKIIARRN